MENNQILNQDGSTLSNIHSEQIKEEFYKWFESRGLLAELRAYMRQLMVRALEENNKNGKKKWTKKSATSPKLQAINLLVVDHLFHEDFFYTVSVFASEARILDSLPQYSSYVTQSVQQRRWDPESLPRFSQQETEDILDTLHLPPTRQQLRQAVDCYLASRESLLACVVRTLVPHNSDNDSVAEEEEIQDHSQCSVSADISHVQSSYPLWSQEMQQLLLMAGLKLAHIQRMQLKWAQTIESERRQARREAEEEFAAREAEWQRVVEERLQEERSDLRERQSQVEVREQSLATLAEHLTAVHHDVTQRLSQLQLQSEQIDERAVQQEKERLRLQQKTKELKAREENLRFVLSNQNERDLRQSLHNVNEGVPVSKSDIPTKEAFVQVSRENELGVNVSTQTLDVGSVVSTQTLGVAVVASTQTVNTEDHELQTSLEQPDPEMVAQLERTRRKISELQEENLELRAHILQQRQRIDELTNRAANLSSQLEESQVAVAVLSGRESGTVAANLNPPPPPPAVIAPTFGFRAPQRQGGGEESLFVPRPQQTAARPDGRRRPLRFAFSQQPSPTSGESSPTDEVIQNARSRIQQLEHEGVAIQRNFQDFQTRLFTTDSVMFPPLRAPRISDAVMRVRRSDVTSNLPSARLNFQPPSIDNLNRLIHNRQLYEEREDSSSEFYDAIQIESLSNSRRLFSHRNIRHYERWKQFKKKFQRRDGADFHRRHLKALNSNTSSDDEDMESQSMRRRQDLNQTRKVFNSQVSTEDKKNNEDFDHKPVANLDKITESKEITHVQGGHEGEMASTSRDPLQKKSLEKLTGSKENETVENQDKIGTGIQIALDLERSAKIIESVKVLLEAQSMKDSGATTLSNGSIAVESLPRDSTNNSPVDPNRTESSFVTIHNLKPSKENNTEGNNCNSTENINNFSQNQNSVNKRDPSPNNFELEESPPQTSSQQQPDKRKETLGLGNNAKNSNTPILESNFEHEEIASNLAGTSSDAGEVESGDRATTSVTSGSDILRELNPSLKTDSSSSVISAGFGDDSKQSSDFWD